MENPRIAIVFFLILMILAVACAQQPAPPAPEPSKPAQTQTAPQPSQPAQTTPQASQPAPATVQTAKTVSVTIKSFKFTPADITINVGDTVVWTNGDSVPHTVESSDGTFRSDELSNGDTYSYKFTKAEKYNYICGIHPSMHGSVTVQ